MDNKIDQTLGAENNRLLISHNFLGGEFRSGIAECPRLMFSWGCNQAVDHGCMCSHLKIWLGVGDEIHLQNHNVVVRPQPFTFASPQGWRCYGNWLISGQATQNKAKENAQDCSHSFFCLFGCFRSNLKSKTHHLCLILFDKSKWSSVHFLGDEIRWWWDDQEARITEAMLETTYHHSPSGL